MISETDSSVKKENLLIGFVFFSGLLLAVLAYFPGLFGPFLFDDFPNLSTLGAGDGVRDWASLKRYLLSGFSGPTGRPISLATFLINAQDWPADPFGFKVTNLAIHLFNSFLLYFVIAQVMRAYEGGAQITRLAKTVALVSALVWVLHPYLVSTTLYVVQRMAMLPLTFSLLGILAWIRVRSSCIENSTVKYVLLCLVLGVFTLLATFSKENGALFPVLVLVLEFTIFSSAFGPLHKWWKLTFLLIPFFLICAYLISKAAIYGWSVDYGNRDFSPKERVLTQFRIIWEYIYQWFIPHINTTGIYHDTVVVSRGWLAPVSTIFGFIAVVVVAVISIAFRKRAPLFSLAVLFFLSSQLIESTTVSLELKFEHRVYLGSIFLWLPIVYFLAKYCEFRKFLLISSLLIIVLTGFTFVRSQLWGNYSDMILIWAQKNPYSARAQTELGKMLYEAGQLADSFSVLDSASDNIKGNVSLDLTRLMVKCKFSEVTSEERNGLLKLASSSLYKPTTFNLLQSLLEWSVDKSCSGLDNQFVIDLMRSWLSYERNNVKTSLAYSQLTYFLGISLLRNGDVDALDVLDLSLESRAEPQKMMNIAAYLATYGYLSEAEHIAERALALVSDNELHGRMLAEAPPIGDIEVFIEALGIDRSNRRPVQGGAD